MVGVTPIGEFEQGFYVEFVGRSHSYLHHLRNGVQIGLYNGFHDRWVSISPVGSLYAEEAKGEKGKLSQAGEMIIGGNISNMHGEKCYYQYNGTSV